MVMLEFWRSPEEGSPVVQVLNQKPCSVGYYEQGHSAEWNTLSENTHCRISLSIDTLCSEGYVFPGGQVS
jgi:hypothetical protein